MRNLRRLRLKDKEIYKNKQTRKWSQKDVTVFLKKSLSSRVSVSALAMTGTMLTTLLRRLMNSTSRGRRLKSKETTLENELDREKKEADRL